MSLIQERPQSFDTPYLAFPHEAKSIFVGNYEVLEYISPTLMDYFLSTFAETVNFEAYDTVFVNMKGGQFFFNKLAEIKGYEKPPILIEYHRPNGGFGASVTVPVPNHLRGSRGLVVDDIYDSGGVLRAIMNELSPDSSAVALVTKNGIQNQIQIPRLSIGLKIDNVWIGGCGMDIGFEDEDDVIRNYPGIVVKKTK